MHESLRQRIRGSVVAVIGYLLSPLSWWNDLYVNIPIACALAWPISLLDRHLFDPFVIIFYWLTNLLGLLLLHRGLRSATAGGTETGPLRRQLLSAVLLSLAYSGILAALVYTGLLRPPHEYFSR